MGYSLAAVRRARKVIAVHPVDARLRVDGAAARAAAVLAVTRPTADVDIVLHIETGATTSSVSAVLDRLGYTVHKSIDDDAPAHRFVHGKQQIDVMVADHLAPKQIPRLGGRQPFQVTGGTQALQRTVNCRMIVDDAGPVFISIPNTLGALVLKGPPTGKIPETRSGIWTTPSSCVQPSGIP
ncbi:hypothetical protein GCM10023063_07500 [Arthrobacter methylotrophus]